MKKILVGKKQTVVLVDDDFVAPDGYFLAITSSTGYVKLMRFTDQRRPSGSYVYEEIYLHRWLTKVEGKQVVMFLDGDRQNLQSENLLVCERAVSIRHTGGRTGRFKGVYYDKRRDKWVAQITHAGVCRTLGSFKDEEHAAHVYNQAAIRLHGKHAFLNILPEDNT